MTFVYVIGGHPLPIVVSNNSNFILINKSIVHLAILFLKYFLGFQNI
jgi:hypothetical protein